MQQFLLIDGNAIMHRAFHALPPLSNDRGEVTNAVYGFSAMLLTLLTEVKPQYLVVCFDRPGPTFRKELYKEYQQHRPKMSDDLVPQMQMMHEVLGDMQVPIFEMDGFEADDVIGTLSVQAVQHDLSVTIVSGDRDLLQLVNGHVRMLSPLSGITKTIIYDSTEVERKFGVTPKQIIDYKALVGDASDGYAGVAGIGPKTASDLLKTYQTVENVYQHLSEINPKIADKLKAGEREAELAKKLATIILDVPVKFDKAKAEVSIIDWQGARKAFEKYGFKSLIKRLPKEAIDPAAKREKNSDQLELL